jgi:hypothetical protein
VTQLYPQALFVASYTSQGYGGGIQTHLHIRRMGLSAPSLYNLGTNATENTISFIASIA